MAKENNLVKDAQVLIDELINLLSFDARATVSLDTTAEEPVLKINIEAADSGLLIGAHGATVNAIQSFIALALRQKTNEWHTVSVDVGDWRARHEDYLKNLARQAAERAVATGEPQNLYNLTPAQRRIIHVYLAEEKGIETESLGEGESRYLIIKPK